MGKSSTPPLLMVGQGGELADIRYGSGFTPVDPVVFLDTGRARHLVVPLLEVGRARQEAPGVVVHTPQDLPISVEERRNLGQWARGLLKLTRHRRVRVPRSFPCGVYACLQRAGLRVDILEEPTYPGRAIKSATEIRNIVETQRAAVAAMRAAVREIRMAGVDGRGFLVRGRKRLTAEAVKMVIEGELLKRNCVSRDTIVAHGRQAADPHHRGAGPLRAGETIVLDIFPQHKGHGYWGDLTRTVVKGPARPELQALYRAVARAQRNALRLIRPGARADRIHNQVRRDLEDAGYVTETRQGLPVGFFHGTGHGLGLDIHAGRAGGDGGAGVVLSGTRRGAYRRHGGGDTGGSAHPVCLRKCL